MIVTVIEANKSEREYFQDLWKFRELFFFLAWRDLKVRYKQTVVGVAWAVVRPLLAMFVFSVIFGHFAKLPTEGSAPYPILVFAALLPWQFFTNALSATGDSVVSNANLISKIYFPRIIIPASSLIVGFVDFLLSFFVFFLIMAYYSFLPSIRVMYLPFFLISAFCAALGGGLWLAALNVRYRDFRHIVPFIVQFGLYISPVGFSSSIVPDTWRFLFSLNPMVGVIDGFRWAIIGESSLYMPGFIASNLLSIILLLSGVSYFRRTEKTFADVI